MIFEEERHLQWNIENKIPWPGLRGSYILEKINKKDNLYSIESVYITPGHIALLLKKKNIIEKEDNDITVFIVFDAITKRIKNDMIDTIKLKIKDIDRLFVQSNSKSPVTSNITSNILTSSSPYLISRHEINIINVLFINDENEYNNINILRCIVAQEDGMTYIWKWIPASIDHRNHTISNENNNNYNNTTEGKWIFENKLCFLENENFKWKKSVLNFDMHKINNGSYEIIYHSYNNEEKKVISNEMDFPSGGKKEKLVFRGIKFIMNQEVDTVVMYDSFNKPTKKLYFLSKATRKNDIFGLWICTDTKVYYRCFSPVGLYSIKISDIVNNIDHFFCTIHQITGDLFLVLKNGDVHMFSFSYNTTNSIVHRCVCTLKQWIPSLEKNDTKKIRTCGNYLLVIYNLHSVATYSLRHGNIINQVSLTDYGVNTDAKFFLSTSFSSFVGIYSNNNIIYLKPNYGKISSFSNSSLYKAPETSLNSGGNHLDDTNFAKVRDAFSRLAQLVKSLMNRNLANTGFNDKSSLLKHMNKLIDFIDSFIQNPILILGMIYAERYEKMNFEPNNCKTFFRNELVFEPYFCNKIEIIIRQIKKTQEFSLETHSYMDGVTILNIKLLDQFENLLKLLKKKKSLFKPIISSPTTRTSILSIEEINLVKLSPLQLISKCGNITGKRNGLSLLFKIETLLLNNAINFHHVVDDPKLLELSIKCLKISSIRCHLLYYDEKKLSEFSFEKNNSALNSHCYYEILCRLYHGLYPKLLPRFVFFINRIFDNNFALLETNAGIHRSAVFNRDYAQRALYYTKSPSYDNVNINEQISNQKSIESETEINERLDAYIKLLLMAGFYMETVRLLLILHKNTDCLLVWKLIYSNAYGEDVTETSNRFRAYMRLKNNHKTKKSKKNNIPLECLNGIFSFIFKIFLQNYCYNKESKEWLIILLQYKPKSISTISICKIIQEISINYSEYNDMNSLHRNDHKSRHFTVDDFKDMIVASM